MILTCLDLYDKRIFYIFFSVFLISLVNFVFFNFFNIFSKIVFLFACC